MKPAAACLALMLNCPLLAIAEAGPALYRLFLEQAAPTDCIEVDIDLSHGETALTTPEVLRYPLRGKEIAEGWSWPDSTSRDLDYYRYKYLPLASESEDGQRYQAEDKIGEPQTMTERWRYDYFLAFANYAAFVASDDDDAALVVPLPPGTESVKLGLHAEACLTPPVTRESTTFWKATHAAPVDLTLKKRYLVGELTAIHVVDLDDGRRLASLKPRPPQPIAKKESKHD